MTSVTETSTAGREGDRAAGRRAATRVASELLGVAPERVEIVNAADGAPQARLDGEPADVALSLSHRHGRALAVAAPAGVRVGCDLERIERRHPALAARLGLAAGAGDLEVTLAWAAREALAKALREPVGLDARAAMATAEEAEPGAWAGLDLGEPWRGWWMREDDFVAVVVSDSDARPG